MPMLMLIDCSSVLVTSSAFRLGYRYQQSEWKNYHFPVFGIVRIRAANGRAGDPINCRSRAIRGLKSYDWLRCVRASQTEYSISRVEWLLNDSSTCFIDRLNPRSSAGAAIFEINTSLLTVRVLGRMSGVKRAFRLALCQLRCRRTPSKTDRHPQMTGSEF